jgi:hypothetical protein
MDKTLHISTNNTTETTVDSVVFSIISQFVERANIGKAKYGTTLDREDLSILEMDSTRTRRTYGCYPIFGKTKESLRE